MARLVAFLLEVGPVVCIDCDVYPPDSRNINEDDPLVETAECDICGQPLKEVTPIS